VRRGLVTGRAVEGLVLTAGIGTVSDNGCIHGPHHLEKRLFDPVGSDTEIRKLP
jgi:hypothetical protein